MFVYIYSPYRYTALHLTDVPETARLVLLPLIPFAPPKPDPCMLSPPSLSQCTMTEGNQKSQQLHALLRRRSELMFPLIPFQ